MNPRAVRKPGLATVVQFVGLLALVSLLDRIRAIVFGPRTPP